MLVRLLSVDVSVPNLDVGLDLYRDKLELDMLTAPVEDDGIRWQALGVGGESCVRLLQAQDPGPLKDNVDSAGHGFKRLSFLVEDLGRIPHQLASSAIDFEEKADRIVIPPKAAFGLAIELYAKDFVAANQTGDIAPRKAPLFSKFATADISVPNIEEALVFYCDRLGMTQLTNVLEGNKGYLRMASVGIGPRSAMGLLQPTREGPMLKRVQKAGYGFHQLSFLSDDVAATVRALRDRGLNVIIEEADWGPEPNQPGPNTPEAFVHPRSAFGVLIEFFRTDHYIAQDHRPRLRTQPSTFSPQSR